MVTLVKNLALDDAATSTQTGTVGEPSVAASRSAMFATGNWYASRSTDSGSTWQFIDPFAEFPSDRGEFCCDQLVLWAPKQKLWIWLLQYSETTSGNIFRVAVSPDAAPGNWHWWDVAPSEVNPSWKTWFDYPDMALSDSHLWISFNQYTAESWTRAAVFRYPLDALADVVRGDTTSLTREHWATTKHGSLRFVLGATDTMWWASNDVSSHALPVFAWPDSGSSVESWVVQVGPWDGGDYTSVGPGKAPWLSRSDDRVTAGWRLPASGTGAAGAPRLGWMWTSGRHDDRPHPYVRAVTISETSLKVVAEPDLWSTTGAWAYPAAAVSARGRVGISAFFGGGVDHAAHSVGVLGASGTSWTMKRTAVSTHGPAQGKWGDYLTVQPHPGRPASFVASGFTLRGGQDRKFVEPRVVVFRP